MEKVEKMINDIVGKSLIAAIKLMEEAKIMYRIAARDNESFVLTRDYNPNRLNLYVKSGKIDQVKCG